MDKKDCKVGMFKVGMFVAVMQNTSQLPKNRKKVKRIGKIIGVYDGYVNLMLYDSDFSDIKNIKIKRKLYRESFSFSEISEIDGEIIYEEL